MDDFCSQEDELRERLYPPEFLCSLLFSHTPNRRGRLWANAAHGVTSVCAAKGRDPPAHSGWVSLQPHSAAHAAVTDPFGWGGIADSGEKIRAAHSLSPTERTTKLQTQL